MWKWQICGIHYCGKESKTFFWDHWQARRKMPFYWGKEISSLLEVVTPTPAVFCPFRNRKIQKGQNEKAQMKSHSYQKWVRLWSPQHPHPRLSARRQEPEVLRITVGCFPGGSAYTTLTSSHSESHRNQLKALLEPWACYVAWVLVCDQGWNPLNTVGIFQSKGLSSVLSALLCPAPTHPTPFPGGSVHTQGLAPLLHTWVTSKSDLSFVLLVNRKLFFWEDCWISLLWLPMSFICSSSQTTPSPCFLMASLVPVRMPSHHGHTARFPKFISAPPASHLFSLLSRSPFSPVTALELVPWLPFLFSSILYATTEVNFS